MRPVQAMGSVDSRGHNTPIITPPASSTIESLRRVTVFAREMKSVSLRSGDDKLMGDILPGDAAIDFAVVWVHGFGSHRGGEKAEAVREECARRGWTFAAFDFRGHGDSTGAIPSLRASSLIEDLSAIRAFLAERNVTRLGLI